MFAAQVKKTSFNFEFLPIRLSILFTLLTFGDPIGE